MSQVAIYKCKNPETTPHTVLEHLEAITDSIRKRAFNIFENRKGEHGFDLDDWLEAERDVVWSPASELVEGKENFQARVALAGFDAKDVEVTVTPEALIIEAEKTHTHDAKEGAVRFCEFSNKKLLRRIDLPMVINVDKVTASLDNGMLQVNAPKAAQAKQISAAA
jgi:HSP20 family molecular chaperone IbpA